jgi:DNA-binding transcriptional MocR family regulator
MDLALRRRPAALILTPRAQNPTGACLSPRRAGDLQAVLTRYSTPLLIENDPLGPVAGAPAITLTEGRSRWAIVRSTTKFLGPDLRLAMVAGDELTLARVRGRQAVGIRWVSHILQHLALTLWSDPSSGRHLARVGETYAHRRRALIEALSSASIPVAAGSGFNVWIPVPHEADIVEGLAQRGWAVAAGERFRLRSGPGIRVTTSALEPDAAQRFAIDLASVLRTEAPALA